MMVEALQKQYALIQKAREIELSFLDSVVAADLTVPVAACQNQDIRHLLVHNADCYLYWLGYMALAQEVEWPNDQDFNNVADIRRLYLTVDETMAVFLKTFANIMDVHIDNTRSQAEKLQASPLMIFTHVTTHEFHHKGQIMLMCRQLGYPPPGTDVYHSFY